MAAVEHAQAPGIGARGEVVISNFGTRAVKVAGGLLTPASLHEEVGDEAFRAPGITRSIVKGLSREQFGVGGLVLNHTAPFTVEAEIPFVTSGGEHLYWNVVGRNAAERTPPAHQVKGQHELIRAIATDPRYAPSPVDDLHAFVQSHNPGLAYYFDRVTPDTFPELEAGLRALYGAAFRSYPYDVVTAMGQSCGDNLFVVARDGSGRVFSVTGAEYMDLGGVTVAEIGDTASLPEVAGFGPLLKRVLFQSMVESGREPDLAFTDSRLDSHGSVIKANRRAGLRLNPHIVLPAHTTIASERTHGQELMQTGPGGEQFPVENMTMTHITGQGIRDIIATYGQAY